MPEEKRIRSKLWGNILVAIGAAERVSSPETADNGSQAEQSSQTVGKPLGKAPAIPTSKKSLVVTASRTAPVSDEKWQQYAKALLQKILDATPEKFQEFLKQRETSLDVLKDTLSDNEKLNSKAIEMAMRVTKLKAADVKNAFTEARAALNNERKAFTSQLESERAEQVDEPKKNIGETQSEIANIESEIAKLQKEKASKEASIAGIRQEIQEAEEQLQEGQRIFERSCASVADTLTEIEKQLLNHPELKGGTK